MKRKSPSSVKTKTKSSPKKEDLLEIPPFHIMFPFTLHHKDGKVKKSCYFCSSEHMKSYITRYKIKKAECTIEKTQPRIKECDEKSS